MQHRQDNWEPTTPNLLHKLHLSYSWACVKMTLYWYQKCSEISSPPLWKLTKAPLCRTFPQSPLHPPPRFSFHTSDIIPLLSKTRLPFYVGLDDLPSAPLRFGGADISIHLPNVYSFLKFWRFPSPMEDFRHRPNSQKRFKAAAF